jgi:high-affinity iron transporter
MKKVSVLQTASKKIAVFVLTVMMTTVLCPALQAAEFSSWNEIADAMADVLEEAFVRYRSGDSASAKKTVDEAYFGYYEKLGFEKTVMAYISGAAAAKTEYQFSLIKKGMTGGAAEQDIAESIALLVGYLRADASQLDGKAESPWGVLLGSLLIILREGVEAIIILGAIIAYLVKSGNRKSTQSVYVGAVIALGASVVLAAAFSFFTGTGAGQNREILEGATMLLAVAVLFYVSNWMVSKSEAKVWSHYIEGKVQNSISKGSTFSLIFAAFLAVFREGAETILYYIAHLANTDSYRGMVWIGLGIGIVLLAVIFVLIRILSVRLPLKPFFLGTSILLFALSVTFIGSGIKALQTANLISVTPVPGIAAVDILGIYPTMETLIPQAALLVVTAMAFVFQIRRGKSKGGKKLAG